MSVARPELSELPHWPRLLSVVQAASYLGVSSGTFRAYVGITPVKIGDKVLFDRLELDAWVDAHREGSETSAKELMRRLGGDDSAAARR